ncbi:MAG: hypothetical protein ACFB0B_05090 [Thermonemataceae bacterium]
MKKIAGTKEQEEETVDIERQTVNYKDAHNIGILFSSSHEENHKAINYFVKLLQKDGKKIHVLAYFEEKHTNPFDFRFDFFTKQDIDSHGRVQCLQANEFMEKRFDYLYCINPQHLGYFEYILHRSQAKCRVGKYHPESVGSFELMINTLDCADTVDLILQMLHYTKGLITHNSGGSTKKPKKKVTTS